MFFNFSCIYSFICRISNRERVRHAIKYDGVVSKHDMFRKRPEGDVVASENGIVLKLILHAQ